MLAKAASLPADQVFLDLEDSVAPGQKSDEARQNVVDALAQEWAAGTLVVRVNSVDTPYCFQDLVYVVSRAGARIDCVMVPKVEDATHLHFVDHLLTQLEAMHGLERRIGLEAQIETARGDRERRAHRARLDAARNADLRARRLRRVGRRPPALRRDDRGGLSRRPVALRPLADRDDGARVRPPGDRRAVLADPRPRRLP